MQLSDWMPLIALIIAILVWLGIVTAGFGLTGLAIWLILGLIASFWWPLRLAENMEGVDWLEVFKTLPLGVAMGPVSFWTMKPL